MRDDDPISKPPKKLMDEDEQGFELMRVDEKRKNSDN